MKAWIFVILFSVGCAVSDTVPDSEGSGGAGGQGSGGSGGQTDCDDGNPCTRDIEGAPGHCAHSLNNPDGSKVCP